MSTRLLALLLLAGGAAASAADRDFDRVVKAIESHYGTRRTHIPLMGVANFFVKVARPAGTSSFHLAIFENLDTSVEDRDDFMYRLDRGNLHPLVRVRSSREHEATYIFAAESGKSIHLLLTVFDRHEAVVIEAKVNQEALQRILDRPELAARSYLGKRDDPGDDR